MNVACNGAGRHRQKRRVLVVEDDVLIGKLMTEVLRAHDITIIGPACTIQEAMQAIRTHVIDCALLDVNLREGEITPVAEELSRRSVPFIVMSGQSRYELLPALLAAAPRLTKPFRVDELVSQVARSCSTQN
jgi:DNA-binding response OmpR family regulator